MTPPRATTSELRCDFKRPMTEIKKARITVLDVMPQCQLALRMLADCYIKLKPGSTNRDFFLEIVDWVEKYDSPSVDNPDEIVKQFLRPELDEKVLCWLAQQVVGPILISVAYCVRARRNYQLGFHEVAWSDTANAMYWCGVARTANGIDALMLKTRTEARAEGAAQAISNKGKSGAAKRSKGFEPLRERARQCALLPNKKWSSRTQAANVITKELLKYCEEQAVLAEVKMRPPACRTVYEWLGEIPEATFLFPSKKSIK